MRMATLYLFKEKISGACCACCGRCRSAARRSKPREHLLFLHKTQAAQTAMGMGLDRWRSS